MPIVRAEGTTRCRTTPARNGAITTSAPYTARVTSTNRPEQAIVDWILRETGYEAWHSDPLALLERQPSHAERLSHAARCRPSWRKMVDRFVNTEAESHAFGMRVVTIGSPNWRAKAHPMLQARGRADAGSAGLAAGTRRTRR